jgi:hypothetical protein
MFYPHRGLNKISMEKNEEKAPDDVFAIQAVDFKLLFILRIL